MPNGERPAARRPQGCHGRRRPHRAAPRRGFTWLLLLFSLAIGAAGLAALGTQWQQAAQHERETELLFRGLQLRDALLRFRAQAPDGQPALPRTLDELLADTRRAEPRHHLRRLWADPFTGQADWVLLRAADGGIVGLHSRSARPLLRHAGLPAGVSVPEAAATTASDAPAAGPATLRARDWLFSIQPAGPHAAGGPTTTSRSRSPPP